MPSRGATETGILQPNVRDEDDRIQEESESDGEVPQGFLINFPMYTRNRSTVAYEVDELDGADDLTQGAIKGEGEYQCESSDV